MDWRDGRVDEGNGLENRSGFCPPGVRIPASPLIGTAAFGFRMSNLNARSQDPAPVAQWIRASGYEPEGREFESLRAYFQKRR